MTREEFLNRYWRGEYMPNTVLYKSRESNAASNRGFLVRWRATVVLCASGTCAAVGAFVVHPCPAHALAILVIWGTAIVCMVRKIK